MAFALNAREDHFRDNDSVLTVSSYHEVRLLAVIGARLILYNPRDTLKSHYYGIGQISDVLPSSDIRGTVDIFFDFVERLSAPIFLEEMNTLTGASPLAFHHYAKIVRPISEHAYLLVMDRIPTAALLGFEEMIQNQFQLETHKSRLARVRSALVRNQTIRLLGRACLFCGAQWTDLTGRLFETEIVHIVPLANEGPDSVRNTVPACRRCHFYIDNGVLGLDDYGLILFARPDRELQEPPWRQRIDLSQSQIAPRLEFIRWHRKNIFGKGATKAKYRVELQAAYQFG
jgi:hypothetical protein